MPRIKYDEPKHWKVLDHLKIREPRTIAQLVELTGMTEEDVRKGITGLRRLNYNVRNRAGTLSFWLKKGAPPPKGPSRWQESRLPR